MLITPSIDSDMIQLALQRAAARLQDHFVREEGEVYRVEDLEQALASWLELSVEALVDDALFHTVEGDRSFAFNRRAFESQMKRLQPVDPTQIEALPIKEIAAA